MASAGHRSDDVRRTLSGWKEIAAYLGVDPRSAQRKEKELGLPVRRVQTQKSAKPYAYSDEIDAWRQKQSIPPVQKRPRKVFLQTLTALGFVVVVGLAFVWPKRALVDKSYASSVLARRVLTRAASAKGALVEIPVTASPGNLVVTPDEQKIFYINSWDADSAVYVLDLSDHSVRAIGLPFKTHRIGLNARRSPRPGGFYR